MSKSQKITPVKS